jgi:periplasmic divalent cation tolerance protein
MMDSPAATDTPDPADYCVVFVTCPDAALAKALARGLVEAKLAACASILPGIQSTYTWQGKVEEAPEWLLMIKTIRIQFESLCQWVRERHPYTVPEIIACPLSAGNPAYLRWIQTTLA